MHKSSSTHPASQGARGRIQHTLRRCLLLAALVCGIARADATDDLDTSRFSFRGFGTLGVARSSSNDDRPLRDIAQPKGISNTWSARNDSVFGLQASYRFNDSLEAVVQGATFKRDDASYEPELSWAFLKYDVTPRLALRFGRVGAEFLMQADSRRVGYSYLPVRPAVDFYGIIPFGSADGMDAVLRWPLGEGTLSLEALAGQASGNIPAYDLDGSRLLRGTLGYDWGHWQVRYIYAQGKLSENIPSVEPLRNTLTMLGATSAADALAFKDATARYHSLGMTYDDGRWQVQAAVSRITHESAMMENLRAGTVLVARRFGDITPFAGYTWTKSSGKTLDSGLPNPMFAPVNDALAQALVSSRVHRQTRTLGVRWDFARNMDIKAQIDFIHGGKSSTLLFEDRASRGDGKTKVFSLSFDFVF